MARGMWSGLAAGFAQAQERKRLEQERQDKLGLIAQERQDRLDARAQEKELFNLKRKDDLFATLIQIAPNYTRGATLTPASKGGSSSATGSAAASGEFYEEQLARFKFPTNAILDLQEKGPYALQAAIEVYKDRYDPTSPPSADDLQRIADGILLEDVGQAVDPQEFAKTFNLNLDSYPEDERAMKEEILRRALAPKAPSVASTSMETKPIKPEDVERYQTIIKDTIAQALEQGKISNPEGERQAFVSAQTEFEKGNPGTAIRLLQERGELLPLMKPLFDYFPVLQNPSVPLGVFDSVRQALTPVQANIPDQALQFLLMNKDNPSIVSAFEQKYGVSAEEYF